MISGKSSEEIEKYYHDLKKEVEASGYHFSPDEEFVKELLKVFWSTKRDMDTRPALVAWLLVTEKRIWI